MLLKLQTLSDTDKRKLMDIYAESNRQNVPYFYPDCEDRAAGVLLVEQAFLAMIENEFFKTEGNAYYVWEENDEWVSALRLYRVKEQLYYIEALETAPKRRRHGYGKQLLHAVITVLKQSGSFSLYDCVSKENTASLQTHKSAGFEIASDTGYDYLNDEKYEYDYSMVYSYR